MLNHDFIRLKKLHLAYGDVHYFLQELSDEFAKLEEKRIELTIQLDRLRAEEKVIINNLEKELGREVTPQDLLEIIKETDEL
jgi:seryl-tRNA synthetase